MNIPEAIKPVGDVAATSVLVGVLADIITATAGLFTIAWYSIRAYEKWTGLPFHKTPFVLWWKNKRNQ